MGKRTHILLLLSVIGVWQVAGCETADLQSAWQVQDIVIQPGIADWPGPMTQLENGKVSLGVSNNGDYLYLALAVNDLEGDVYSQYAQALGTNGLTVWLDPQGGDQKFFGIRFLQSNARGSDDLELVDAKGLGFSTSAEVLAGYGFNAASSYSENHYSCVIKLPLRAKDQTFFPAAFAASKAIGVDFESVEADAHPGAGVGKHHGGRRGGSGGQSTQANNSAPVPTPVPSGFNGNGVNGVSPGETSPGGSNGGGDSLDVSNHLSVDLRVDLASGQSPVTSNP